MKLLFFGILFVGLVSAGLETFSFGGRSNKLYVPNNPQKGPLYVMLHGCTQNPTDFSKGTQIDPIAEDRGFYVLYPEQTSSANLNKCWNWFETGDQKRGSGEPKLIADMTKAVMDKYSTIDPERVYVAGLSAGAAMSVIMGATYPDIYSGLCSAAGLEYQAATSMISAFTAMSSGGPNPTTQAGKAYDAGKGNARKMGVFVTQGTSDTTVAPVNGQQVTTSSVVYNQLCDAEISTSPSGSQQATSPGGTTYTETWYTDESTGMDLVLSWDIKGMGHAWSGGSSAGTYTDPKGPDTTARMIKFFDDLYDGDYSVNQSTYVSSTMPTPTEVVPDYPETYYAIVEETGYVSLNNGLGNDKVMTGDNGLYTLVLFHAILSFDPTPVGSYNVEDISDIVLRAKIKNIEDAIIKDINVDLDAPYFGNSVDLEPADSYVKALVPNVAKVSLKKKDEWVEASLDKKVWSYVTDGVEYSGSQRVQLRLTLEIGIKVTASSNSVEFYGGPGDSEQPELRIEFKKD